VAFTQGAVENAYNIGSVSGSGGIAGGIVAFVNGGTISNVYNAGTVTATYETGAIIGALGSGTVTNSFWDVAYTGAMSGIGFTFGGTTQNLAGYPDDQMMDELNFSEYGWDFGQTWGIAEGSTYPFLLALTTRGVTARGDYCSTGGTACVADGQGANWTFADVELQSLNGSTTRQPFHAYLQCRSVYRGSDGNLYQDVGLVDTAAPGGTLTGTMLLFGGQAIVIATASSTLSGLPALPDPGQELSDRATVTGVGVFNALGNNGTGRMTAGIYRLSISGDIPSYMWDGSQWQLSQVKSNARISCAVGPSMNVLYDRGLSQSTPNADAAAVHA